MNEDIIQQINEQLKQQTTTVHQLCKMQSERIAQLEDSNKNYEDVNKQHAAKISQNEEVIALMQQEILTLKTQLLQDNQPQKEKQAEILKQLVLANQEKIGKPLHTQKQACTKRLFQAQQSYYLKAYPERFKQAQDIPLESLQKENEYYSNNHRNPDFQSQVLHCFYDYDQYVAELQTLIHQQGVHLPVLWHTMQVFKEAGFLQDAIQVLINRVAGNKTYTNRPEFKQWVGQGMGRKKKPGNKIPLGLKKILLPTHIKVTPATWQQRSSKKKKRGGEDETTEQEYCMEEEEEEGKEKSDSFEETNLSKQCEIDEREIQQQCEQLQELLPQNETLTEQNYLGCILKPQSQKQEKSQSSDEDIFFGMSQENGIY